MSITFGANIAALHAKSRLGQAETELSKSFERLSSGLRINRPGDDDAGLAMATTLRSQSKVYSQAVRNINDGLSYLTTIESAADSLTDIIARMQELAEQASNGAYTDAQRGTLDTEFQELSSEYDRIIAVTTFNGRNVLTQAELLSGITIQAGYGSGEAITAAFTNGLGSFGPGDGTFLSAVSSSIGANGNLGLTSGDFNGDGNLDIAETATNQTVRILLGNGDGTFAAAISTHTPSFSFSAAASADFDNDGKLDLILGTNVGVMGIMLGNGDGTFEAAVTHVSSAQTYNPIAVDINGDGKMDIAALSTLSTPNALDIWIGNGDGTFNLVVSTNMPATSGLALLDLNGDSKLDAVTVAAANAYMQVSFGNGDGTFDGAVSYFVGSGGAVIGLAAGDFNGDGKADLIAGNSFAGSDAFYVLLLGNGDGTFQARSSALVGNNSTFGRQSFNVFDFNADGKLDFTLARTTATASEVDVFLGNGDGTFSVSQLADDPANSLPLNVVLGDFNSDGAQDIVAGHNASSRLSYFEGVPAASVLPSVSSLSIASESEAQSALTALSSGSDQLSSFRGQVGAFTSRLSFAVALSSTRAENYAAAADSITSLDVAEEVAQLVKKQVLAEAATAILAQANQQQQIVLALLKDSGL